MKKPHQLISALYFLSDILAVTGGYLLAYFLRFHVEVVPVTKGIPSLALYLYFLPVGLTVWLAASSLNGLYSAQRKPTFIDETLAVGRAGSLATLILIALTFFYREYTFSRATLVLFWFLSIILASLLRILLIHIMKVRYRRGFSLRNVLIVGAGPLGRLVAEKVGGLPQLGLRVAGFIDDELPEGSRLDGPGVLGGTDRIPELIGRHHIDQVLVALPLDEHEKLEQVLLLLDKEVVDVKVVPDILQFVLLKAGLESIDGIPIINLSETPLSGWYGPVKRFADIIFSFSALVLFSPVMALIAVIIKTTSSGPVFYRQRRMSLDGTVFTMLKFRSMREDAEADTGAVWTSPGDPRRTRFGAFLRRTSLDELPQLVNILRGEMSFVGPRPERPVFVEQFREQIPRYMLRHKVKCGLTGWAQVNGWRGNTSIHKRIEYDMFYIENWSFSFDLKIIWLTAWNGLVSKHAY